MLKVIFKYAGILFCFNVMSQPAIIGRTFDPESNVYFTLYSSGCKDSQYSGAYPFHWEASNLSGGIVNFPNGQIVAGCYVLDEQSSRVMLNVYGFVMPRPFSSFKIAK